MDRDGVVRLDDVVSSAWLQSARSYVESHLSERGERDATIRLAQDDDSPARPLVTDPDIQALLAGLTEKGCPNGLPQDAADVNVMLRILAGPVRNGVPYWFHYDASVVTMILPIMVPDARPGESGELILLPNRRQFHRSVLRNIAEKLLTQNPLYRRRIKRQVQRAHGQQVVNLAPGSAYLFWGYRALHGNMPCAPNALRATLMLHYGDPHHHHPLLAAAKAIRMAGHRLRFR
jgi:hypothetical protein